MTASTIPRRSGSRPAKQTKQRRVALLVETSRAFGRGLLEGIARYVRLRGDWTVTHHERSLGDDVPPWLTPASCDGIIARIDTPELLAHIRELRLPTVDLRALYSVPGVPAIINDDQGIARLAFEHLTERRFPHYAYCGIPGTDYSRRRMGHFVELLRAAGVEPRVYGDDDAPEPTMAAAAAAGPAPGHTTEFEARALLNEGGLGDWLASLPKPVSLLACNDLRARQVLNLCHDRGIAVPFDVAVLGIADDKIMCELANPPLSSVRPNTHAIGEAACVMLERLFAGETEQPALTLVAPVCVVARASTDAQAIDDADVAAALKFIREQACSGANVEDVLDRVAVSRSTLERRFARFVGRSPKQEMLRVRLERLKQLLLETDQPLHVIARSAGFQHQEHMSVLFKSKTGMTPGEFRAQARQTAVR